MDGSSGGRDTGCGKLSHALVDNVLGTQKYIPISEMPKHTGNLYFPKGS